MLAVLIVICFRSLFFNCHISELLGVRVNPKAINLETLLRNAGTCDGIVKTFENTHNYIKGT